MREIIRGIVANSKKQKPRGLIFRKIVLRRSKQKLVSGRPSQSAAQARPSMRRVCLLPLNSTLCALVQCTYKYFVCCACKKVGLLVPSFLSSLSFWLVTVLQVPSLLTRQVHAVVHCNESRWPRLSAGAAATTVFKTENVFPTTLCSKRSSLMSILLIWFPLTRFFSLSSACSCTLQQVSVAKTVCYSSSYFIIQNSKLKTTHVVKPLLNTRKPACQIALLYIS